MKLERGKRMEDKGRKVQGRWREERVWKAEEGKGIKYIEREGHGR